MAKSCFVRGLWILMLQHCILAVLLCSFVPRGLYRTERLVADFCDESAKGSIGLTGAIHGHKRSCFGYLCTAICLLHMLFVQ